MKLRDLDGQFVRDADASGYSTANADSIEGAQGVLFQCPLCAVGKETGEEEGRRFVRGAHYIRIFFANPIGAVVAPHEADHNPRWTMSGGSIDDLTLSPSVNLDVPRGDPGCPWHGWVQNGDAT